MITEEQVTNKIFLIRGQKVMLDIDLATLYAVETRVLNQAVKRNVNRFPEDFMFQLNENEWQNLRSQIVISSFAHGGNRYLPFAFTEQGVAMLSSVLKSEIAIAVNIQIIRVFTKMREVLQSNKEILRQLEKIERSVSGHDEAIVRIFEYLKKLLTPPKLPPRPKIGFRSRDELE